MSLRFEYKPLPEQIPYKFERGVLDGPTEVEHTFKLGPSDSWDVGPSPNQTGFPLEILVEGGPDPAPSVFIRTTGQVLSLKGSPPLALMPIIFPDRPISEGQDWDTLLFVGDAEAPPLPIALTYLGPIGSLHRFQAAGTITRDEVETTIQGEYVFDYELGQLMFAQTEIRSSGEGTVRERWIRTDLPADKLPDVAGD